ncbi:MAG TPA: TIR domain-containing protein [Pyrinomonadaceae bacterium]
MGDPGRVITFYSYAGGVGQTMTLANVAWMLASAGKRVVALDWDFVAPGLHRYFHPFLLDKELLYTGGLIDFFSECSFEAAAPGDAGPETEWFEEQAERFCGYAVSVEWEFPGDGALDFVPSGKQGPAYASRVNAFDWAGFLGRRAGQSLVETVRARLRADYDYVLLDSQQGVSDVAGLCTTLMPDALVACFTLNPRNIDGAAVVARLAFEQRRAQGLRVYPLTMRDEPAEYDLRSHARRYARWKFSPFPNNDDIGGANWSLYWDEASIPYIPRYAYGDTLAAFGGEPNTPLSMLGAVERLTKYLTDSEVTSFTPPDPEQASRVALRYRLPFLPPEGGAAGEEETQPATYAPPPTAQFQGAAADFSDEAEEMAAAAAPEAAAGGRVVRIFISYNHDDRGYVEETKSLGQSLKGLKRDGAKLWYDAHLRVGDDWDERIREQIRSSDIAVLFVTQLFLDSDYIRDVEIPLLLERRGEGLVVFPIIVEEFDRENQQYKWLHTLTYIPTDDESYTANYYDERTRPGFHSRVRKALREYVEQKLAAM